MVRLETEAFAPDGSGKLFAFTGTLVRCEPGTALEWTGGVPLILKGRHYFHLSASSGGTRLVHGEDFFGLYTLIAGRKRLPGLRPAYEGLNRALAERVAKVHGRAHAPVA
ncbi:SRPBCC family protein [Pyxidicoccus xibeiensis]|uniref:hypothetical protein n=1 Tax=Pyxidicoccus xibeiensis TaxID=2906759 RepID=UPI0020A8198D|nr:hypothetical protein [Pyxidicoccus xibeiensis]MCP3142963.1 hypothetical protein [Pyxidicoccus xibeiensis]